MQAFAKIDLDLGRPDSPAPLYYHLLTAHLTLSFYCARQCYPLSRLSTI
jgi:hypothetical protein